MNCWLGLRAVCYGLDQRGSFPRANRCQGGAASILLGAAGRLPGGCQFSSKVNMMILIFVAKWETFVGHFDLQPLMLTGEGVGGMLRITAPAASVAVSLSACCGWDCTETEMASNTI